MKQFLNECTAEREIMALAECCEAARGFGVRAGTVHPIVCGFSN
jgi:hypothetical protein